MMSSLSMSLQVQGAQLQSVRLKRHSRRSWLALLLLGGSLLLSVPPALADGEPTGAKVRTLVKSSEAWNGTRLPAYPPIRKANRKSPCCTSPSRRG
jgi:hypothetical protein